MRPWAALAGLFLSACPLLAGEPALQLPEKKKKAEESGPAAREREARAILALQSRPGLSPEKQADLMLRTERLVESLGSIRFDPFTGVAAGGRAPTPAELEVWADYSRAREAGRPAVPEPRENVIQEASRKAALFYRWKAGEQLAAAADGPGLAGRIYHYGLAAAFLTAESVSAIVRGEPETVEAASYSAGLGSFAATMRISAASMSGPRALVVGVGASILAALGYKDGVQSLGAALNAPSAYTLTMAAWETLSGAPRRLWGRVQEAADAAWHAGQMRKLAEAKRAEDRAFFERLGEIRDFAYERSRLIGPVSLWRWKGVSDEGMEAAAKLGPQKGPTCAVYSIAACAKANKAGGDLERAMAEAAAIERERIASQIARVEGELVQARGPQRNIWLTIKSALLVQRRLRRDLEKLEKAARRPDGEIVPGLRIQDEFEVISRLQLKGERVGDGFFGPEPELWTADLIRERAAAVAPAVREELEAGRAVLVNVNYVGGHAVAALRVGRDRAGEEFVQLYDPAPGAIISIPWKDFFPLFAISVKE